MTELRPSNRYHSLGVINLTPNSFSDGGQLSSFSLVFNRILELYEQGCRHIDIGAESTAPFNESISMKDEVDRFDELFFPIFASNRLPEDLVLSFDTYRSTTMEYILERMKEVDSKYKLIWNDISGVLDMEAIDLLKLNPDLDYVLSHNLSIHRKVGSEHMKFLHTELVLSDVVDFFKTKLNKFSEYSLTNKIIIDPCYGFSKSREQNFMLIRDIAKLMSNFSTELSLFIGLSKKSFLQSLVQSNNEVKDESYWRQVERYHLQSVSYIMGQITDREIFFRVHDPSIVNEAMNFQQSVLE